MEIIFSVFLIFAFLFLLLGLFYRKLIFILLSGVIFSFLAFASVSWEITTKLSLMYVLFAFGVFSLGYFLILFLMSVVKRFK